MYSEEELELRASQLMYLQDREGYLDDHLASHGDIMRHQASMASLKTSTFQLLQVCAPSSKVYEACTVTGFHFQLLVLYHAGLKGVTYVPY